MTAMKTFCAASNLCSMLESNSCPTALSQFKQLVMKHFNFMGNPSPSETHMDNKFDSAFDHAVQAERDTTKSQKLSSKTWSMFPWTGIHSKLLHLCQQKNTTASHIFTFQRISVNNIVYLPCSHMSLQHPQAYDVHPDSIAYFYPDMQGSSSNAFPGIILQIFTFHNRPRQQISDDDIYMIINLLDPAPEPNPFASYEDFHAAIWVFPPKQKLEIVRCSQLKCHSIWRPWRGEKRIVMRPLDRVCFESYFKPSSCLCIFRNSEAIILFGPA